MKSEGNEAAIIHQRSNMSTTQNQEDKQHHNLSRTLLFALRSFYPRFSHIICWMPHGQTWRVLSPQKFVDEVAPHCFEYPNYHSFQRLVNAWGFRHIKKGTDVNA